jgi:predicted small lipoprotein YifL
MRRWTLFPALAAALLAAAACGRKGELVLVPKAARPAVADAAAVQRGPEVVLRWRLPAAPGSNGSSKPIETIEILVSEAAASGGSSPAREPAPGPQARLLARLPRAAFSSYADREGEDPDMMAYRWRPEPPSPGRRLTFSFRTLDGRGRRLGDAVSVELELSACPLPPSGLTARTEAFCIRLAWAPPSGNTDGSTPARLDGYNILRAEPEGAFRKVASVPGGAVSYEDRGFEFGRRYVYLVRAFVRGDGGQVESADPEPAEVAAEDVFAPAVPTEVTAVAGAGLVSLTWTAVADPDLAGYVVWRREAASGFVRLSREPVRETSFSDASAVAGREYVYAVSAVDLRGNESPRREAAAVTAREGQP